MALHHAPDGDDGLARAVFLQPAGLDQRVDGLFLGRVDEAAGVDDDDLGVGEIGDRLGASSDEAREIPLAVDGVLVAAQCDEADFHSGKASGLIQWEEPQNDHRRPQNGAAACQFCGLLRPSAVTRHRQR